MDSSEKTTEHLINYVFISACMQIIVQTETIQQKQEAANRLQESNVLSTRSRATLQRAQGQCALKHPYAEICCALEGQVVALEQGKRRDNNCRLHVLSTMSYGMCSCVG